jgi:rhodanese-related sulfurtransferase
VLLEREAPDTIQAWFIGMDPFLDDEPPVLVLRRDPERVVRAARSFLAYG